MSSMGWIGVDLDGTLATHLGWHGPLVIGAPIPKMVARVKRWLAAGWEVRIVTARVGPQGRSEVPVEEVRRAIEDYCELHVGRRLQVTAEKDYNMLELWDDRAVQVIPNTGERADGRD